MSLPIVFFGTAELATASLSALLRSPFQQTGTAPSRSETPPAWKVVAVVTQPDRPKGRSLKPEPSPVKQCALTHGIPILQPERARDPEFHATLAKLQPALFVVAAYGQILPRPILELPHHGSLNIHTSLLPKYRGAAPIQWALLNGDSETGVTLMKMDEGLDTGDIVAVRSTSIEAADDAITLHARLATMGAELLIDTLPGYLEGNVQPVPQPVEGASYARKINKGDGLIDWGRPAAEIGNQIRALVPWPGCFTYLQAESRPLLLKIWEAIPTAAHGSSPGEIVVAARDELVVACGTGSLRIGALQLEGGRRLAPSAFLAGHRLQPGDRFIPGPTSPSPTN